VTPLPPDSPPAEHGEHQPGDGAAPAEPLLVDEVGLHGSLGAPDLDAALVDAAREALRRGTSRTIELGGRSLFVEAFPVRPRMVIVGATEIARSLASIAATLGYERVVIDARPAFAAQERFPDVEQLINDWPDDAFESIDLGPDDAVAVLSHDPKFDEPAIAEAFRRGARYVGAVGSRRTQADRRARLLDVGVSEADLARLRGPIGLDLGGRAPAETALAIMAEVVADRYGASARPMIERARPAEVTT
jgi:xanthine dehydrogenase accessory factor